MVNTGSSLSSVFRDYTDQVESFGLDEAWLDITGSLALQEEQKENRKLCGRCYNKKYADYICVDAMGNLLKPDYLSDSFQIILRNYHLRRIRFHDLRHSCASLLLANGVPMKMIQEWLGHSDFSTTANIYSHLDYASKVSSAEAMLNGLGMGSNPENDT